MAPPRLNAGSADADASPAVDPRRQHEVVAASPPSRSASTLAAAAGAPPPVQPSEPVPVPAVDPDDGAAGNAELSDADYLARRMKRHIDDVDVDSTTAELAAQDPLWVQEDGDRLTSSRSAPGDSAPASSDQASALLLTNDPNDPTA